jgi:MFS family permease
MVVLDATVVNVALPKIRDDLGFSVDNLTWVITAYSLTFGGLLLFGGRTGDFFGRRRMFMIGVSLFAGASLVGGLATNEVMLIGARAAQGAGGAIAAPTALALLATTFTEPAARARAFGDAYADLGTAATIVATSPARTPDTPRSLRAPPVTGNFSAPAAARAARPLAVRAAALGSARRRATRGPRRRRPRWR